MAKANANATDALGTVVNLNEQNIPSITPSEYAGILHEVLERNRACASYKDLTHIILYGDPGLGKTFCTEDTVAAFPDLIFPKLPPASAMEGVDMAGCPDIDRVEKVTYFCPPRIFHHPYDAHLAIFLDEADGGRDDVLKSICQGMYSGHIGDTRLPLHTTWILAANLADQQAGGRTIISPVRSRAEQYRLVVSATDWLDWARDHSVVSDITGFIAWKREAGLHTFDAKTARLRLAYANPRQWAKLSGRMASGCNGERLPKVAAATVGSDLAHEFMSFVRMRHNLVDPNKLLDNPEGHQLPTQADQLCAMIASIADLLKTRYDKPSLVSVLKLMHHLSKGHDEFSTHLFLEADAVLKRVTQPNGQKLSYGVTNVDGSRGLGAQWLREHKHLSHHNLELTLPV